MNVKIRRAKVEDIYQIVKLRELMFIDMGYDPNKVKQVSDIFESYFYETIPSEEYFGWVAEIDTKIISTGGMVIDCHPPSIDNISGKFAYIMNMSTMINYRGKGIGRKIIGRMFDHAISMGINHITLHYSEQAKSWYEDLGFEQSNEMKLILTSKSPKM